MFQTGGLDSPKGRLAKRVSEEVSPLLKPLYYDPKTGFSGINSLGRKYNENKVERATPNVCPLSLKQSDVKNFLEQQDIYSRHFPLRRKFPTRRVYVRGIDYQWQTDLVEMIPYAKENQGYRYILTCIDIFSKYSWVIPLKNKTSNEVVRAFEKIFEERIPLKMQTDLGKEFYNTDVKALFEEKGVQHFSTNSNVKASVVERFNRTLKEKMWRYFSQVGTNKWIDVIDDLAHNYNNSFHTSIKMTPVAASEKKNESAVRRNLYGRSIQTSYIDPRGVCSAPSKFKIGDKVRISKWKSIFSKGYLQNYTTEFFKISKVLHTSPVTYKIKDWNDEEIEGIFYEPELVKFDKQDEVYEVEKVLKTRTKNGKKELLILWRGYPKEMASWIPEENFQNTS